MTNGDLVDLQDARKDARLHPAAREAIAKRMQQLSDGRFTRRSLAAEAGLGVGTVMDLFAGRSDPTLGTMLALVEAFDLHSVEELLGPLATEGLLAQQRSATAVSRSG